MSPWNQQSFDGRIESSWYTFEAGERAEAAEALLAAMKLGGIEHLWFVSGSELTVFQEAAVKARALGRPAPKIMTMIHEHAALTAALGEAMVGRRPTSACAHVELGLLNMGGALHNAAKGNFPVLIITGVPSASYPGSGPAGRSSTVFWRQQIRDQGELVRQYTKWDWKLAPYDNPGLTVTRALQVALSRPAGPVYLAVPPESARTPISGTLRFPTLADLTPAGPAAADPALIARAARILVDADDPVLITESLGDTHEAIRPFQELAELLGARVYADSYRYNFPRPHPLGAPATSHMAPDLATADAILVVDAPIPWLPGPNGPRAGTPVIWIDDDPVRQDIPIWEFPATVRMTASSGLAIPALLEELRRILTADDRRRLEARRERRFAEGRERHERLIASIEADGRGETITQRWAGYQLGQAIDPDTIVLGESWNSFSASSVALPRSLPDSYYFHGAASLGFVLSGAVGVKIAAPDRRVVALVGDGSYNFGLASQSFWAARRYGAPYVVLVMNNRGYGTGTKGVVDNYAGGYSMLAGDYTGGYFDPPPNYSAEAQAAGCYGEQVTRPDEVAPAITRALAASDREGIPAVIDVWLPRHLDGRV